MLKHYLKIAFRNITKNKGYTFINIFSLGLSLTVCVLVGLYIYQNFHYDEFHERFERIYRVTQKVIFPSYVFHSAETPGLFAPTLKNNFPEFEKVTRIYFSSNDLVKFGENMFYEDNLIYADPDFFDIFTYENILGNPEEFLEKENSVIITSRIAKKYFGNENPLGKILLINNKLELEVAGIIENVPLNSHFSFDMVGTYNSLYDTSVGNYIEQWGATFGSYTYVLLYPEISKEDFEKKLTGYFADIFSGLSDVTREIVLQPLKRIHLHSQLSDEIQPNSSITHIMIMTSISLFILILACINFTNLTTARAMKRAREIGVKKVFGAFRNQLIRQLLGESILLAFFSLFFAFILIELLKPVFIDLIGTKLEYNLFCNILYIAIILGVTVLMGLIAGIYPAFVLTDFKPISVMKGIIDSTGRQRSAWIRKVLVLVQFSISIILIVAMLVIYRQIDFMKKYDLGFDKEQVMILTTPASMGSKVEIIKKELKSIPGVIKVTANLGLPFTDMGFGTSMHPDTQTGEKSFAIHVKSIDYDFMDFFGIELLSGKRLEDLEGANYTKIAVANETLIRKLGYKNPEYALGESNEIGLSDGVNAFAPEIIGVVKDFHISSLHEEVDPILFVHWPSFFQELAIKVSGDKTGLIIEGIEEVWEKFYPDYPFQFNFLDEQVDKMYRAEQRSFQIITVFSGIAIFIACLGLLGLTFYTTQQRRKEIGLRKVLGATVPSIVVMLSGNFVKWVILANLLAYPLSYILMEKWLRTFAYRIELDMSIFLLAGLISVLIAFLTSCSQTVKTANTNPADVLKYE